MVITFLIVGYLLNAIFKYSFEIIHYFFCKIINSVYLFFLQKISTVNFPFFFIFLIYILKFEYVPS